MAASRSTKKPQFPSFRLDPGVRRGAVLASAVAAALQVLAATPAMAAPSCPSLIAHIQTATCELYEGGLLEVLPDGEIRADLTTQNAVRVWGSNASITNNGVLASNAAGFAAVSILDTATGVSLVNTDTGRIFGSTGVEVGHGTRMKLLRNDGTIWGLTNVAISNQGTIDHIENRRTIDLISGNFTIRNDGDIGILSNVGTADNGGGTISGNGEGTIFNRGTIGTLENSGTITGAHSAIVNDHGGTIGQLINSGLIRGAAPVFSLYASGPAGDYAIWNDGTILYGIMNSGIIDGDVELGSATLYLAGEEGRVTGVVTGGAGSRVEVLGGFTTENNFSADSFLVHANGRLTLGNQMITVQDGVFRNEGGVGVRAGNTATIKGDYVQLSEATLAVEAVSASSYGKLVVEGNAKFENGTRLQVVVTPANTLANGNVLTSVIAATTLEANAKTFTVTDTSELFDFRTIVNPDNTVDLRTVLDTGESPDVGQPGGGAVSNRVSAQGFGQGMGAARVLDGFLASSTNTGDMVNVVDAFGQLGSREEVVDAVAQTLPLMSASVNQVTMNGMQGVNRVIQGRQASLAGLSSGEGFLADKNLWFKPLASYVDQDNRNGVAGYRANTYGFVLGGDALVSKASRLGLAFSYARTDVNGKSTARNNRADIDAYQLIAYGSHGFSAMPDVQFSWQADVGMNRNEGRRAMRFGGLDRTAESEFDSTTAHLGAAVGRGFRLGENTGFTPSLRMDYFRIHNESYTERGADALNLRVGAQTSEQLIAMIEGQLQQRVTDRASLMASLGVGYDLIGESNAITSSYVGGGAAFQTPGLQPRRWLGRAGLGLSYQATENAELTARYDVEGRSGMVAQTASVNVRWAF